MQRKIKVAVVDDQQLFKQGIVSLLSEYSDLKVLFEAADGKELLHILKTKKPDVILLDLEMPNMNGIDATVKIRELYPYIKIIILTMHNNEEFVLDLFKKGAHGYLLKNQEIDVVVDAIYTVMDKGIYLNPKISEKLASGLLKSNLLNEPLKAPSFSEKELRIIELICKGMTNKEMADDLALSVRTIDGHCERIFQKAGIKNRAGMAVYALKNRLVVKSFD